MYPAVPTAVAVTEDGLHLLVYSDTHIDVFDVHSGDWVQVREGGFYLCKNKSTFMSFQL